MRSILALFVVLSSTVTFANGLDNNAEYKSCMSNAENTLEMKICAGEVLQTQTSIMNDLVKQVIARTAVDTKDKSIDAETRKSMEQEHKEIAGRLLKAQKSFLRFRADQCSFEGIEALGGTLEGVIVTSCEAGMTMDRVDTLKTILKSSEN